MGETIISVEQSPFAEYTPFDWAMYFIERYGQIDGEHHKLWVLDQVARIHKGTPILIAQAAWSNGHTEWRITLGEPTKDYEDWVHEMRFDGEDEYYYDEGVAP